MRNALTSTVAALAFIASASAAAAVECDADKISSGENIFKRCKACHIVEEKKNRVGPTLNGVVGRPVASISDFKYSDAMKAYANENPTWDESHLVTYLEKPRAIVKGTKMAFAGLPKVEDREAVVCYLGQFN